MIEAKKAEGNKCVARCKCDICGEETSIPAMHRDAVAGGAATRKLELSEPGMVNRRLLDKGWSLVGHKLRCPDCEAARKTPKEKPAVTNVEPIRQPTREQKRQITEMLTATYDITAGRYTGSETDVTIADAIGGGCMFGWVAAIREDMFGPDGGNEEHEALIKDIAQWRANADKLAADMHGNLREFNDARAKVAALEARLVAVVKVAGPKAARA